MNAYPNAPHAWDRTRGLARSLGVDLPAAVLDGWLTRRELDGLVCTCAACGLADCQTAPSLPADCSNSAEILSLRL